MHHCRDLPAVGVVDDMDAAYVRARPLVGDGSHDVVPTVHNGIEQAPEKEAPIPRAMRTGEDVRPWLAGWPPVLTAGWGYSCGGELLPDMSLPGT